MEGEFTAKEPIGHHIRRLRKAHDLSQGEVANRLTSNLARISRIESGEVVPTDEEVVGLLNIFNSPEAQELKTHLDQTWTELPGRGVPKPRFDHPDRRALRTAEETLQRLAPQYNDPDAKNVFLKRLEVFRQELVDSAKYLASTEHTIAFAGSLGVGKTTALCKLTGLWDKDAVLETGAGGTTVCEVRIVAGPRWGILVEPKSEDEIRADVMDFSDHIFRLAQPDHESISQEVTDSLGVSKEIVRAIRNMSQLGTTRRKDGNKQVRVDPARNLAAAVESPRELAVEILGRMQLPRRDQRSAWYPSDESAPPLQWLRSTFSAINNGRKHDFPLPKVIQVITPTPILNDEELNLTLVDTKGIDQTALRADLACHFDDPRAIVALCSKFNDAPENSIQSLLEAARDAACLGIETNSLVLVLPQGDQALECRDPTDGTKAATHAEGYELKQEDVELRLTEMRLGGIETAFLNALGSDDAHDTRQRLTMKLRAIRRLHSTRIHELSEAIDELIENRDNATREELYRSVARQAYTWIDRNKQLDTLRNESHAPLLAELGSAHASTINACMRREGDWINLDYWHQLGVGARKIAVSVTDQKRRDAMAIITNLKNNPEYSDAVFFLTRIEKLLEKHVDEFYKQMQIAGRAAFEDTLRRDTEFWRDCIGEWGSGPGYRNRIVHRNKDWFQDSEHENVHKFVAQMIEKGWQEILAVLAEALETSPVPA